MLTCSTQSERVPENEQGPGKELGGEDSNPRMPGPKPGALPLGDRPMLSPKNLWVLKIAEPNFKSFEVLKPNKSNRYLWRKQP